MSIEAKRKDAYRLFMQGSEALADLQYRGIHIDVPYYKGMLRKIELRTERQKKELMERKEMKLWKRIYKNKFKISSGDQLADLLFNHLDHTPIYFTDGSRDSDNPKPSTKEKHLKSYKIAFLKKLIKYFKVERSGKKIKEILREEVDGFIHPNFGLSFVKTYRGQCEMPNFMNLSVRDKEIAEIERAGIISRPGRELGEIDCKANEVKAGTCYHLDPVMMEYLNNKKKDMHRDMAMRCYKLRRKQVSKDIRYCGKNKFVFPEFYGDYYVDCARDMWSAIGSMKLETEDKGIPLKEHLASVDLPTYGHFENHIKQVEDMFWNDMFTVYRDWKESTWKGYLKTGFVEMLTGFRCYELVKKNELINRGIQGTAFHWLLWGLIELNKHIKKTKMQSLIIAQIHDSLLNDIVPEERDELFGVAKEIMCERIRKHWDWIIVPLEVEAEVSPVDGSWFEKEEVEI